MRTESDFVAYQAVCKLPGQSVLVLAPHPDDEVFGCGGALVRHSQAGDVVSVRVVTDGAFGQADLVRSEHAAMRAAESRAAAQVLGYSDLAFLSYRDRELAGCDGLVLELLKIVGELDVDLIYVPSIDEMHPDHHALALAALRAVALCARDVSIAMYEVGRPLSRVTHLVDVTEVFGVKQEAMRCFPSQMHHQSYDRHIIALNTFRTYTLPKEVHYAEAFWVIGKDEIPGVMQLATLQDPPADVGDQSSFAEPPSTAEALNCAVLLQQQVQRNGQLAEQVAALSTELDRVYHSNTWRFTAPLRALRRVVTGMLGSSARR